MAGGRSRWGGAVRRALPGLRQEIVLGRRWMPREWMTPRAVEDRKQDMVMGRAGGAGWSEVGHPPGPWTALWV